LLLAAAAAETAPLRAFDTERITDEGIVHLNLDDDARAELTSRGRVVLDDVPLAPQVQFDLELSRVSVYGPQARIVIADGDQQRAGDASDSVLLAGTVVDDADSLAVLSLAGEQVQGLVWIDDETFIISSGPAANPGELVAFGMERIADDLIEWVEHTCYADRIAQIPALLREADPGAGRQALRDDIACRVVPLAIETDRELLRDLFNDDINAATAYVELLVGATNEIYKRDFNATYEIVFLRLWESSDPWNQNSTVDQLYQFQGYWNANMTDVQRGLAHYLSGRGLGGGVAWVGAICADGYDYALSANLAGYFPYPLQDNHAQNWDIMVFAHEGGHNFGAPHTHDIGVDGCAYGDCGVAPNGTIMSYCHLCPGGLENIVLEFHPRIIDEEILPYLQWNVPCDLSVGPPSITDQPSDGSICVGTDLVLAVAAEGGNLTYQWRQDGVEIPGAESTTYAIQDATLADAGDYDVIVSNDCESTVSEAATVDVYTLSADLNGDGAVGQDDLGILLGAFGNSDAGDVDGDGDTDQADLGALLGQYGDAC
jgi:hypothetical protein